MFGVLRPGTTVKIGIDKTRSDKTRIDRTEFCFAFVTKVNFARGVFFGPKIIVSLPTKLISLISLQTFLSLLVYLLLPI